MILIKTWIVQFRAPTNFVVLSPIWDSKNMQLSVSEPYFALLISWSPKIAQKWFCIQNLRLDLSFQEKKTIWKSNAWFTRNLQNKHGTIFFKHPVDTLYHNMRRHAASLPFQHILIQLVKLYNLHTRPGQSLIKSVGAF